MNAHTRNIKPAPLVALPHMNESAFNQADQAMTFLRSAMALVSMGDRMGAEAVHDVFTLMEHATHLLEPVRTFLEDVSHDDENMERFREARRAWVLSRQGGAV